VKPVWHGGPSLLGEAALQKRRQVDAPQTPVTVALERLKQHAGREAACDTRLDDPFGPKVPREAPREPA
jgi:hypothetical protein